MNIEDCKSCANARLFFEKKVSSNIKYLEDYCSIYCLIKDTNDICVCHECVVKTVCKIPSCEKSREFLTILENRDD